jgi:hypothetical protein
MSAHAVFRAVVEKFGKPLAAPSANRFGRISPTTAAHVLAELDGRIPLILDGGPCPHGIESTIVHVRPEGLQILRHGPISEDDLRPFAPILSGSATVSTPGGLKSHYAPRTPLILEKNPTPHGEKTGLLAFSQPREGFAKIEILSPAADLRDVLPSKVEKHHACIHPSELPDLLRAMETRQPDLGKFAMQLLALTFVRTGELIGARWDEIDWAKEEWRIPKERMKMKRPHVVPLSTQALAILREVQKRTGDKEFIFFSAASADKHISNGTVLMALRRMGYQGRMTGHGFRTLASTILNEKGYAPDVIERQLAHEDEDRVRAAYNRAEYLLDRKKMMQEYADWLDAVVTAKPTKVVAMGISKATASV